jgi:hypothetical protein
MWQEDELKKGEAAMKENLRHILIFTITLATGTLFVMLNLPLLVILPVTAAIAIAFLILFGAIPVTLITKPFVKNNKISLLKKSAERKETGKSQEPTFEQVVVKPVPPPVKERKRGISFHLGSLVSSFKALGTILATRKRKGSEKVEEIDKLLDGTISEKVIAPGLASAGAGAEVTGSAAIRREGGARSAPDQPSPQDQPEDPFLSLSSDELETGLLDGIEDEEQGTGPSTHSDAATSPSVPLPSGGSGIAFGDSDIPVPPQEIVSQAQDVSPSAEPDPDDFGDFEDAEFIDQDLGELDTIDFDAINLDDEKGGEEPEVKATTSAPVVPGAETTALQPSYDIRRDQGRADQSDMAAFTAVTGADDSMVNSIAEDIKTVKKSEDLLLLRELKDFKAPGKEIEEELTDLYKALDTAAEKQRTLKQSPRLQEK